MAIDKIVRNIVEDDAVTQPKIAASAVDNTKLNKTAITGLTELTSVADGDQLIISDTSASGALKKITKVRTTSLDFPTYTSISPTSSQTADGGNITFTITGSGFTAGTNARLISNTGVKLNFDTVTRTNTTTISGTIARSSLLLAQSPYDIQVINGEGLSVVGANQITIDNTPVFVTGAGSLGTVTEGDAVDIEVIARDPDSSSAVTFELQSGSLPAGLSLVNQSGDSCRITGTASAVSADTTSNFTLRAFDSASNTVSRAFSITVNDFSMNSARFNIGSSDSLTRTLGTPTNAKIFTISFWTKLIEDPAGNGQEIMAGGTDGSNETFFRYNNQEKIQFRHDHSSDTNWHLQTTQKFRDPSAWYHFVAAVDTTQATASNRVKLYVNGSQITDLATANYPAQNEETFLNKNAAVSIGKQNYGSQPTFGGYLSDFNFIDGTALTPTSFGETDGNGVWVPINPSGLTYGNNGFRLDFADASDLGDDESGNGNDFTENNLTSIDKAEDSPQNNYCTLNPLNATLTNSTLSEGNLQFAGGRQDVNYAYVSGTIAPSQGKWYWEVKAVDNAEIDQVGVAKMDLAQFSNLSSSGGLQATTYGGKAVQFSNGNKAGDGSQSSFMGGFSANDIMMIALDLDNGNIYYGRNGQWSNGSGGADQSFPGTAAFTNLTVGDAYVPAHNMRNYGGSNAGESEYNFGNPPFTISSSNSDGNGYGSFEYAVPSGYYALNTKNLAQYG